MYCIQNAYWNTVPVQSVRYFACFIVESAELNRSKFSMRGQQ